MNPQDTLLRLEKLVEESRITLQEIKGEREAIRQSVDSLAELIKGEISNATKQLEAYMRIHRFLDSAVMEPDLHGWPISPDFALSIIDLLDKNEYDAVLEFGSGTSTLIIAKALKAIKDKKNLDHSPIHVTFEHMEKYYLKTKNELEHVGLQAGLTIAPLTDYSAPDGTNYKYYDLHESLKVLGGSAKKGISNILMVVDGPPASTGAHARYPALPLVLNHLSSQRLQIILDDYNREDEKEVVGKWLRDLTEAGYIYEVEVMRMEKGAVLLTAWRSYDG